MIYICKCLSRNLKSRQFKTSNYLAAMIIWLTVLLPCVANSQALVTQVRGEVTLQLPGRDPIELKPGAWLANHNHNLQLGSGQSQLWLLCLGLDKPINVREVKKHESLCPSQDSSKMRGGEDDKTPFLILPNQLALDSINRVIWSGPKDAEYLIMLVQYDEIGRPTVLREWTTDGHIYNESGFHELLIEPAFPLSFAKESSVTYKLEVENIDDSQTSASFDEIFISPITRNQSKTIIQQARDFLANQQIDPNSDLGKLVYATYLYGQGYFAQAYEIVSSIENGQYKASASWLKARILFRPGTPSNIIVREFHKSLEIAVASRDYAAARLACGSLLSPPNNLLDEETKIIRNRIKSASEFSPFCKE